MLALEFYQMKSVNALNRLYTQMHASAHQGKGLGLGIAHVHFEKSVCDLFEKSSRRFHENTLCVERTSVYLWLSVFSDSSSRWKTSVSWTVEGLSRRHHLFVHRFDHTWVIVLSFIPWGRYSWRWHWLSFLDRSAVSWGYILLPELIYFLIDLEWYLFQLFWQLLTFFVETFFCFLGRLMHLIRFRLRSIGSFHFLFFQSLFLFSFFFSFLLSFHSFLLADFVASIFCFDSWLVNTAIFLVGKQFELL